MLALSLLLACLSAPAAAVLDTVASSTSTTASLLSTGLGGLSRAQATQISSDFLRAFNSVSDRQEHLRLTLTCIRHTWVLVQIIYVHHSVRVTCLQYTRIHAT